MVRDGRKELVDGKKPLKALGIHKDHYCSFVESHLLAPAGEERSAKGDIKIP